MSQDNLEGLRQDLKAVAGLLVTCWAENTTLKNILRENGTPFEERLGEIPKNTLLLEEAFRRFQPQIEQLDRDIRAVWIEMQKINESNSGQS